MVVKKPNLKIDWDICSDHATIRMSERGITKDMADSFVKNGVAFSQGNKILFLSTEGAAVVGLDGKLITTYGKNNFDESIREIISELFGG